jgi:hypothetical protein
MVISFYNFLNIEIEHPELDFITLDSKYIDGEDIEKLSTRSVILKLKKYLNLYMDKMILGFNRREVINPIINNYLLNLKCLLG